MPRAVARTATVQQGKTLPTLYTVGGFISHSSDGYLVHLSVRQAGDSNESTAVEETVDSPDAMPARLAQMIGRLRVQMGETESSVRENAGDLSEATANLAALSSAAEGDARIETGDDAGALAAYSAAIRQAPQFTAARLRLASLLLRLHADRDAFASLAAVAALPAATGPHLRAEREYLLAIRRSRVEALAAADQWRSSRPADADAQNAWTEQLLRTGRTGEALTSAHTALRQDPYRLDAEELETRAELANGLSDVAWATQTRAYNAGLGSIGLSLAAAVLQNDAAETQSALAQLRSAKPTPTLLLQDAIFRANTGDAAGAAAAFDRAEASAGALQGAASAAVYVAALKGWNLALAGDCPGAASSAASTGEAAVLVWMTSAWCHLPAPSSAEIAGNLRTEASRRWIAEDKAGALALLNSAHDSEASLLRARLEQALHQPDAAISDARAVADRRGAAYLSNGITYPAALALLAAVYRGTGDSTNAAIQQSALRDAWKNPEAVAKLLQASAKAR